MKKAMTLFVAMMMVGVSWGASAGTVTGTLMRITVDRQTNSILLKVHYTSTYPGKPTCSTDANWDFSIGSGSTKENQLYALALTLLATGETATFYGTGNCSDGYGRAEGLLLLTTPPI